VSLTDKQSWGEVERLARQHEASINQVLVSAGLPLVHISIEDRMRGGILSAIAEIEAGHTHLALADLRNCLKL